MSEALQTVIGEFKTLSPDITSTMVFRLDGEILAASQGTTPEQTQILIANLNSITHAKCIGGLENFTIQDVNSQLAVAAVGDVYLAMVSLRTADQKIIKSLTQVVAPTVIRLASGMVAVAIEKPKVSPEAALDTLYSAESPELKVISEIESLPEPFLPKAPTTQFMVEKIGGLLVASDIVRIDNDVIQSWQNLYDGKQFTFVSIETLEGKSVTCKFKAQKGARGMIQIPDKILQTLQSGKGKLVMVKPVIG